MDLPSLLKQVRELRAKGATVDAAALESALESIAAEARAAADSRQEREKTRELQHASNLAQYSAESTLKLEKFKAHQQGSHLMLQAVMSFASGALKAALIINGGAAVAILAFLGNARGAIAESLLFPRALAWFTAGILCAAMASAGVYLSQYYYAKDYYSEANQKIGNRWRAGSIGLVVLSYVAFSSGSWSAYCGFSERIRSQPETPVSAPRLPASAAEATPEVAPAPPQPGATP